MWSIELVEQAIDLGLSILPSMLLLTERKYQSIEKPQMYITVVRKKPDTKHSAWTNDIVSERTYGNKRSWPSDKDFKAMSYRKAGFSHRTGKNSAEAPTSPMELAIDDPLIPGSVVVGDFIVSVSGWEPWLDQRLAYAIAHWIEALLARKLKELQAEGWLIAA